MHLFRGSMKILCVLDGFITSELLLNQCIMSVKQLLIDEMADWSEGELALMYDCRSSAY